VAALFAGAKKGRVWYGVNPDSAAEAAGQPRRRIVRALEVLEERGLVDLRAADVRQQYTRLRPPDDAAALTSELVARFRRREEQEEARLQRVVDLVTHPTCQVNALVGYFGERRAAPCGHCSACLGGGTASWPEEPEAPRLPVGLDVAAFRALQRAHPQALSDPRQAARFLCGLSSPATTRARITRHGLFGVLAARRFRDVLDWCAVSSESA
jgi:ATP-dependent DNA helicase RecQ